MSPTYLNSPPLLLADNTQNMQAQNNLNWEDGLQPRIRPHKLIRPSTAKPKIVCRNMNADDQILMNVTSYPSMSGSPAN